MANDQNPPENEFEERYRKEKAELTARQAKRDAEWEQAKRKDRQAKRVETGLAVAGQIGSAAGSAGLAVAGGALKASKGMLQLAGKWTWFFAILCAIGHAGLIWTPTPILDVYSASGFFRTFPGLFADTWFIYYMLLALLASFLFYRDRSDPFPLRTFGKFMLFTTAAYLLPIFAVSLMDPNGPLPRALGLAFIPFTALWLFYIFMDPGDHLTQLLSTLFWLGLGIVIIINIVFAIKDEGFVPQTGVAASWDEYKSEFAKIWSGAKDIGNNTVTRVTSLGDLAKAGITNVTQDYYTGQVEQSKGAPLGVTITDVKADLQKFDVGLGDDIIVSATVKARSLADSFTISHACYLTYTNGSGKPGEPITGTVEPLSTTFIYTAEFQDSQPMQCIIRNSKLRPVFDQQRIYSGQVTFNSTYQFETLGYLPFAFMSKDLLASLRRDNIDIRTQLGIETNPVAKYTPGPLMIGMAQATQPFVYEERDHKAVSLPAFGITFSSSMYGKGGLQSLDEVHLYVPKQFELRINDENPDTDAYRPGCNPSELQSGRSSAVSGGPTAADGTWSENPNYWDYVIRDMPVRSNQNFITIRCPLVNNDLGAASTLPVLGPSGAGLFTFYAYAKYTATAEARTSVIIQGVPPTGAP